MFFEHKLLLVILSFQFYGAFSEVVTTESGQLNGTITLSWTGQPFHAFYGIPYAQPPIDSLRFEPPLPVQSWNGVRSAVAYGPICWQPIWQENLPVMGEDCLTLNVFTKNLPSETNNVLKPVIVFIHGGGFRTGSASLEAGPRYLMDRDIVYANINYRLGALGFLATGSKAAPGNMGMKDQVLALKWIKTNIQHFGGDPNKVTISGMSAGGFSVTSLMVSQMAVDLFHGVITHSGALTFAMGIKHSDLESAIFIAKQMGCSSENPEEFVPCLKTKSPEEIINVAYTDAPYCKLISWRPVIEPDFEQERFLTEDPNESFRNGRYPKIPVIAGITANEFATGAYGALFENNLRQLNENYDEVAPNCFSYALAEDTKKVGDILRKAYLPFDTIDVRSFNNLNNFFSDAGIGVGVHRFVHFISNETDVFYFKFSFIGRYSLFNYPHERPYGVQHADDMQYIMSDYISPLYQKSDPESFVVERMTRIYEQFAWSGNPNNSTDEYLSEMNWPKHNSSTEFFMDIGTHFVEKHGLNLERYTVWDSLETSKANSLKFRMVAAPLLFGLVALFIKRASLK
ncbi:Esterase FE4 [Pseudolycoriella hygida]|uniref:Carboxylic ester hydrolase n=1 Tax=Pseudolycoriella hygida TaxID=35572 RepID=A0A9Q0N981_9DIPT|nr:Esterase FE4 [Pseudolycoriella hygida]